MVARAYETFVTPEEYLAMERLAESKSEYVNGQIYAMSGASRNHVRITGNVHASLHGQLRGKSCEPFAQDLRVRVSDTGLYTYPDVVVACEPLEWEDAEFDVLLNPKVIIEVLSPSTEAYDRGAKFAHYRHLKSVSDYVLIAQDAVSIDHYQRQPDGTWVLRTVEPPEGFLELSSIECRVNVADVYERVTFESAPGRAPQSAAPETKS